jgi:hypothetical protein
MTGENTIELARALIQRHGMRAGAVAQEQAAEKQAHHDYEGAEHWQAVARAVTELRAEARAQ